MADATVIGKVAIRVVPKVANERLRMREDLNKQLDDLEKHSKKRKPIKLPAELDEDDLDKSADKAEEKLKKRKEITLRVGFDYDSVLKGTERIRAELQDLGRDDIKIELNESALNDQLHKLNQQLADSTIDMRISDDIDGYKQVLAKIAAIRKEAARTVEINFKANEKSMSAMEKSIHRKFRDQIVDLTGQGLKLTPVMDRAGLRKAIEDIDKAKREIEREPLILQASMNMQDLNRIAAKARKELFDTPIKLRYDPTSKDSILGAIAELRKDIKEKPIGVELEVKKPNEGSVRAVISRLEREIADIDSTIHLKVDYSDQESIKAARAAIEKALKNIQAKPEDLPVKIDEASLLRAKHKLDSFIEDENNREVDINVNPTGLGLAGARLAFLTRPRTVSIIAKVDEKSILIAEGILRSLAGVNVLQRVGNSLENVIRNFDKFAIKSASWMTGIGNLVNVLGYMGTSLFTIGGGVAKVIGLAALMPALAASTAAVFTVMTMGFNNFMQSFSDVPIVAEQALAKLPPAARKARDAMAGLWTAVRDPVQNLFWESLGTSLQDFATRVVPQIGEGLLAITPAVAKFTSRVLDSFKEIANNGQMLAMFKNLGIALENASKGAKPFFDAVNTLGLRGSQYLPRMGTALANMAKDFDEWITKSDANGDINRWIEDGIQSLKDMGGVVKAVTRQFQALTQIIDANGGKGLSGFRTSMEGWADVMEREPFRSRLGNILKGARDGATQLNVGFKKLTTTIGEASEFTGVLLTQLGKIGGGLLSRLGDAIGQTGFQLGIISGLQEIDSAVQDLRPGFKNLGSLIGDTFDLSGTVIKNVVPLLNDISRMLATAVHGLAPELELMVPVLTGFVRNILALTNGPLQVMADLLGVVARVVAGMPGPMQTLTLAFGSFLLLRGRIGGMMTALDGFWTKQRTSMKNGVASVTTYSERYKKAIGQVPTALTTSARATTTGAAAVGTALATVPRHVGRTATAVRAATGKLATAGQGVGRAVGGIAGALGRVASLGGGLGGVLIFTGIIAGITALGDAARRERDKIEAFKDTLDALGNTTVATKNLNADFLSTNSVKMGVSGKSASLTKLLEAIGIGAETATTALGGTDEQFNTLIENMKSKQDELMAKYQARSDELRKQGNPMGDAETADWAAQSSAIGEAITKLEGYQRVADIARQETQDMATAMGRSYLGAKNFGEAIDILGDSASSADDKVNGLSQALEVLNGGAMSKQNAAIAFSDSLRDLKSAMEEATSSGGKGFSFASMFGKDNQIKVGIDVDPTGAAARVSEKMEAGVKAAMQKAMQSVEMLPDDKKPAAFAKAYGRAMQDLKATVVPTIKGGGFDPKASAAFDGWVKANGFENITVEALVDGKIDQKEFDALPKQIQSILTAAGITITPTLDSTYVSDAARQIEAQMQRLQQGSWMIPILIDPSRFNGGLKEASNAGKIFGAQIWDPKLDARPAGLNNKLADASSKGKGLASKTFSPKLDANGKPLTAKLADANSKGKGLAGKTFSPKLDANGKPLTSKVADANAKGSSLGRKVWSPKLNLITSGLGQVQAARSAMSSVNSRKVTLTVHTKYTQSGPKPPGYVARNGVATFNADGAINKTMNHKFMAEGGFFDKPTKAHIAKAGSYVTYAERETGGEAFIPLAASKRARSVGILSEVASMFGMQLTKSARYMADGASGVKNTGNGAMVTIGTMIASDPDEVARKITTSQRDALALNDLRKAVVQ